MKKRVPFVQGRFYPDSGAKILALIERIDQEARYTHEILDVSHIFGAVLPHAGHIYSGHQTVPFFKVLKEQEIWPDTFVIVHPNHSRDGAAIALDDSDTWVNAIGEVPINKEFSRAMELSFDPRAHSGEHSAEVIVPFIQYYLQGHPFNLVAVCMNDQSHESARQVAHSIRKAEIHTGQHIMVLASCDFSHFLSPAVGMKQDQYIVDEILARNPPGLEQAVRKYRLSVCGYGPIMALMNFTMLKDPEYKISVLARGNSGEVTPSADVVDYISMIMYR